MKVSGESQKKFAIHPVGAVAARCIRIIDLGTQSGSYQGKAKVARKVQIVWESSELMPDTEGDFAGKPFLIVQSYTASLNEKAGLRKLLQAWRGRPFTEQELHEFDLKDILGKPCMLNMIHSEPTSDGKVYANIASITPLPKGMVCPDRVNPLVHFSFDDFQQEVFDKLSDNLKSTIAKSPEYTAAISGAPAPKSKPADSVDDDDIPF